MKIHNQVKSVLTCSEAISYIRSILDGNKDINRTGLAKLLCEHYGLYDPRGVPQKDSCLEALRELERNGHIVLPARYNKSELVSQGRLAEPVPPPLGVPENVSEVRGLKLILAESDEQKLIWKEIMTQEHPQGAGPLSDLRLQYLVDSDHGFLGAMAFSPVVLILEGRDKWIGWNVKTRDTHLHRVIAMSRFLIRPQVDCHDLAQHVLRQVIRVVPDDFEKRYRVRPWLVESYADIRSSLGTDFLAARWALVGQTRNRGLMGRARKTDVEENIYLYALEKDFRSKMGLPPGSGLGGLEIAEGLTEESWAENEFGGAPLGDKRLSDRLVACAASQARLPDRSFCGVAEGKWAAAKGYYRFIDHPDEEAVSPDNILKPHRERTIRRMMAQETVLCIQDGTDLNFSSLSCCEGLGVIGSNQTGAKSMGLHLHSTLVVTPDGLPLGVLRAECEAREPKSAEDKRPPASIPIEEKKTYSWILSLRDIKEVARKMPDTHVLSVTDREADIYEVFDEHRNNPCPNVDLLVRAKHNRCIEGGDKLFEAVKDQPECGRLIIPVGRKSARPKKSKQKATPKRSGRMAEASLRYTQVELLPPKSDGENKLPISVTIVHVVENNPPEGEKGIEWFLLTTADVQSAEDAEECLRWYCKRWRIEDWHRVLKSGCCIEDAAHDSAERLKRAIAINLVIAWRIMLMTLLGRETPELPAEVLFSDIEIELLKAVAKQRKLNTPDMLGDAVQLVARLGGYLARNSDPPAGHQLMWEGYITLRAMCAGYALMRE
jgi:hypothetical protein